LNQNRIPERKALPDNDFPDRPDDDTIIDGEGCEACEE